MISFKYRKIIKIPDRDKFYFARNISQQKSKNQLNDILKNQDKLSNICRSLSSVKFSYFFGKFKTVGKILCKEKTGLRIKTNSKVLSLLSKNDFFSFPNLYLIKNLKDLFVNEFFILKFCKHLATEFCVLSFTKLSTNLTKQKNKQIYRCILFVNKTNSRWMNDKGSLTANCEGQTFFPYSKIAQNLKNKRGKFLGSYCSLNKESFYEPILDNSIRYFVLNDQKRKIWLLQTRDFCRKKKFLGAIYKFRYPFGFIVGLDGVPVLLHRNQLLLSCREMKKSAKIFNFNQNLILNIFAKYKKEKRTNIKIDKLLTYKNGNKEFLWLKQQKLILNLRMFNKKIEEKNLFKYL